MAMRFRALLAALVVVGVCVAGAAPLRAWAATAGDQEIQIGRRAAAQIETKVKVVTDPAVADRVSRLGAIVAAQSPRPRLPYTFKVIQMDDVNAVALPGGFIYVTTGLLKFVRSDHELTAVLAHEVAHAALSHGMEMQRRANQAMFVTLLIAVVTRDPALFQGSTLFATGLLAGYTRDLEREADLHSIEYLNRTTYSPVAVLTVLERLLRREQFSPQPPLIFPNHPTTAERVQYVEEALRARQIPLNRRAPANYLVLTVREGTEAGAAYAEILVNDRLIVRLADATPKIREAAEVLDRLFDSDLSPYEVTARETMDGWGIFARGFPILRLTARDLPAASPALRDVVVSISVRLRAVIEDDIRRRRLDG